MERITTFVGSILDSILSKTPDGKITEKVIVSSYRIIQENGRAGELSDQEIQRRFRVYFLEKGVDNLQTHLNRIYLQETATERLQYLESIAERSPFLADYIKSILEKAAHEHKNIVNLDKKNPQTPLGRSIDIASTFFTEVFLQHLRGYSYKGDPYVNASQVLRGLGIDIKPRDMTQSLLESISFFVPPRPHNYN